MTHLELLISRGSVDDMIKATEVILKAVELRVIQPDDAQRLLHPRRASVADGVALIDGSIGDIRARS